MTNTSSRYRTIIGIVILAAGLTLLFRNLNIIDPYGYFYFLFTWKMIIFIAGLILYFSSLNRVERSKQSEKILTRISQVDNNSYV